MKRIFRIFNRFIANSQINNIYAKGRESKKERKLFKYAYIHVEIQLIESHFKFGAAF